MFEFVTYRSFAPEHAEAAIALTREICAECTKQPGFIHMTVYRPHDRRNEIFLIEQWDSEADVKNWVATQAFIDFKEKVAPFSPVTHYMPSERLFSSE